MSRERSGIHTISLPASVWTTLALVLALLWLGAAGGMPRKPSRRRRVQ